MCSKEDYLHIVNKFKDWSKEESKAPAEENEPINEWEDANSREEHDVWFSYPCGEKGSGFV